LQLSVQWPGNPMQPHQTSIKLSQTPSKFSSILSAFFLMHPELPADSRASFYAASGAFDLLQTF
jgi:hypothetical protein